MNDPNDLRRDETLRRMLQTSTKGQKRPPTAVGSRPASQKKNDDGGQGSQAGRRVNLERDNDP